MGYRYVVKSYMWVDGKISAVSAHFDNENQALDYARAVTPAETIKIYVEDEVIHTIRKDPELPMYAG